MVQQFNDVSDDFGLLLVLEVLEVLVNARGLEVIRKELVVSDLSQLPQDFIFVVAQVINIEHSLPPP